MNRQISDRELLKLVTSGRYSVCAVTGEIRPRGRNQPLSTFGSGRQQDRKFVRVYIGKRRRGVPVARMVWMSVTGEVIPTGWEIHHRDKDRSNNAWSNLVCLHRLDHVKYHADDDYEPIPD